MQHNHVVHVSRITGILTWHVDPTWSWYSMWWYFGSWIFEPSRSRISCVLLLCDKRIVFQLYFKYIEVLKMYTNLGRRYLAYVTRPHDWRLRWLMEKENLIEEKNPVEPLPECKNLLSQGKIFAGLWHVLHTRWHVKIISVSSCGEGDRCHSLILLWHVLFAACFVLLSHDDDLHPHETMSVMKFVIV